MDNPVQGKYDHNINLDSIYNQSIKDTLHQYINQILKVERIKMSSKNSYQLRGRFMSDIVSKINLKNILQTESLFPGKKPWYY